MRYRRLVCIALLGCGLSAELARAASAFIEAEAFTATGGWEVVTGDRARMASGLAMLDGSRARRDGVATGTVTIKDAGHYHIWVRYMSHPKWRGPFEVAAVAGGRELGSGKFDLTFEGKSARDLGTWKFFEAVLPEGEVTLRLKKLDQGASGPARLVDCFLLTMDRHEVPNHLHYGAQTFVRVTLGEGYDRPTYVHIFADHFHAPWYQHFSLGCSGAVRSVSAPKQDLLRSGERTAWCNLTPMIYQDSGAMLHLSARHAYTEIASHLTATFEFATAPDEKSIVRTLKIDNRPAGLAVFLPPNLLTRENVELFKTDREIAEATGKVADAFSWPTLGKRPERLPFLVSAVLDGHRNTTDAAVLAREKKTLDYFGFTGENHHLGGLWFKKDDSYCNPDVAKMKAVAATRVAELKAAGGDIDKILYCQLTDEPTGQKLEAIVDDPSYRERFRAWLKALGKSPADLLVADWEAVRIVTERESRQFPALYYFSQRFRTRALGDFMAIQRHILEAAFGRTLPTVVNFSDGATYSANFYAQGVDYFELLDAPDQNAIWGEDWANHSSTYQCASFNVDLMRAAARERGQLIGHHLIAYAHRRPWDVKLKATSELARGVRILNSFCYGPSWATHEGGPYWRSHVWYAKPETWAANASLTREVGAAEDVLLKSAPAPAKVALLYSSSSDVWTIGANLAHGFDRMHTWLALTHAQVPVDILSERHVERGLLDGCDVCYLSGPNLSRAAAQKLRDWVRRGGTLWLAAGAATRDEYDRPLDALQDLLPARRGECLDLQKHSAAGRFLRSLAAKDRVTWPDGAADVLSVKQSLEAGQAADVLARFTDGSPAVVRGAAGKGRVYCVGFLPALAYIKSALDSKATLEERVARGDKSVSAEDAAILERSANPWVYPGDTRDLLLRPVREAGVKAPLECDAPLVDAVYMPHADGVLIPLANYTNRPLGNVSLKVQVARPLGRAESVLRGPVRFRQVADGRVELSMPLENNDFLILSYR